MSNNASQNRPDRADRRSAASKRRLGTKKQCATGVENRPEALISGSDPRTCAACQRTAQGQSATDEHHLAGQHNHAATLPVPVNDHRARLSPAQLDWPTETLRNPNQCPLIKIAACTRGSADYIQYCIDRLLLWVAEALEELSAYLIERLGPDWWKNTTFAEIVEKAVTAK
jgi:hypothetical protein